MQVRRTLKVSLLLSLSLFAVACGSGDGSGGAPADSAAAADTASLIQISNVGFETPESVLYDSVADVYLVSNISGPEVAHDDNGSILSLIHI